MADGFELPKDFRPPATLEVNWDKKTDYERNEWYQHYRGNTLDQFSMSALTGGKLEAMAMATIDNKDVTLSDVDKDVTQAANTVFGWLEKKNYDLVKPVRDYGVSVMGASFKTMKEYFGENMPDGNTLHSMLNGYLGIVGNVQVEDIAKFENANPQIAKLFDDKTKTIDADTLRLYLKNFNQMAFKGKETSVTNLQYWQAKAFEYQFCNWMTVLKGVDAWAIYKNYDKK